MKYKGFLLATAGGLAVAPAAQAADLLTKAPLLPAAPSWTGWYIGAHIGANWQNMNAQNIYAASAQVAHVDGSGVIGGGQIGYNWQHGNSVFGLEADISGLGGGGSWKDGNTTKSVSTKTDWLSTIRARVGLAVTDTMVYATGGVAIGGVKNTQIPFSAFPPLAGQLTKSDTKTKVGWTIGGGIEHMWDAHWIVGLEGLFVDLGKSTATAPFSSTPAKSTTFSNQILIGRARLSYKF